MVTRGNSLYLIVVDPFLFRGPGPDDQLRQVPMSSNKKLRP